MNSGRAARETFSRGDRLRKRTEFEECYSGGVRVSGRHLLLFLRRRRETRESPVPRLGLSVSRKVGNAVTRNRVKRRLREAFRRGRPLEAPGVDKPGVDKIVFDVVVNVRPSAAEATFQALSTELKDLVGRALVRAGPPAPRPAP